jgi:hypothetical protein|tara:strand:+ start:541 stop:714 length:174 start_codon:yes stop_codon:yes gene_type:complete
MIRNKNGELIKLDRNSLSTDKEFYVKLWKKKYNISVNKNRLKETIKRSLNNFGKKKI